MDRGEEETDAVHPSFASREFFYRLAKDGLAPLAQSAERTTFGRYGEAWHIVAATCQGAAAG